MILLPLPFHITPDGISYWISHRFSGDKLLQRTIKIINCDFRCIPGLIYCSSCIHQFSFPVKDVEMWCSEGPIGHGHLLAFVVEIKPGKVMLLHSLDHVRKIVRFISRHAVRIYRNESDTLYRKTFSTLPAYLIGTYDVGTMITGEKYYQELFVEIGQ